MALFQISRVIVRDLDVAGLVFPYEKLQRKIDGNARGSEHERRSRFRVAEDHEFGGRHSHANFDGAGAVIDHGEHFDAFRLQHLLQLRHGLIDRMPAGQTDDSRCRVCVHSPIVSVGHPGLTRIARRHKLRILSMGRKPKKNDSLPGSLDMLILRTLSRGALHGYGIVQFIQQSSDDELLVEEGSLYPALQRLDVNGWIDGEWGVTSNNRRARIYKITAAGRRQLAVETKQYARLTLAIARVMGTE